MRDIQKKSTQAQVTKKREILTYSELWYASKCVLEAGQQNQKGCSWQFLSSIVLTAFSFEAYLNHIGPKILQRWGERDRLPPLGKFNLLCETLEINLPNDKRPRSTLNELINFRNSLAHGRTETIVPKSAVRDVTGDIDGFLGKRPLAKWEDQTQDSKFAERARADVENALKAVHAKVPEPKEFLFTFGMGEGSATVVSD